MSRPFTMSVLDYLALAGFLITLGLGSNLAANLLCFRRPRSRAIPSSEVPLVSILVPARNEAGRIGPCLESLLHQDWPRWEILVLDDRSDDGTAEVVAAFSAREPRIRCISGTALPPGWTGKAWACHQLAEQAAGEFLLFTDADTRHETGSLASAMGEVELGRLDLVSLWPRQDVRTWSERAVVPFMLVLLLVFMPHWMPGRRRSLGAANGQFMLFRRTAYQKIGGHGAVRCHLVDDVALARELKSSGGRVRNLDGSRMVSCRMYESYPQLWEGFSKNLRAGFEASTSAFLVFHAVEFLWGLWPFLVLLGGAAGVSGLGPVALALAAGQVLLVLLQRFWIAWRCRQPLPGVAWHPLAQLLVLAIALNSWRWHAAGKIRWKGRVYPG
ncbi:MAG: glycosyltransferase family 2 protein [Candidatus Methylacidiphilales bacterium]|nr:glycosyltransferase family 2 protein [Candidatus Methylacidiphilales bacterium]